PRTSNLVVGTRDMQRALAGGSVRGATLIEPGFDPVPHDLDADAAAFRLAHGLTRELPIAAIASRLAGGKVEGIRAAIEAVELLDPDRPLQLVIAGEGSSEEELRALGQDV